MHFGSFVFVVQDWLCALSGSFQGDIRLKWRRRRRAPNVFEALDFGKHELGWRINLFIIGISFERLLVILRDGRVINDWALGVSQRERSGFWMFYFVAFFDQQLALHKFCRIKLSLHSFADLYFALLNSIVDHFLAHHLLRLIWVLLKQLNTNTVNQAANCKLLTYIIAQNRVVLRDFAHLVFDGPLEALVSVHSLALGINYRHYDLTVSQFAQLCSLL
jgi:hypothetical protein